MWNEYWSWWSLKSKRERISKNIEIDGLRKAYDSWINKIEGRA